MTAEPLTAAAKALRCKHTFRRVETRPGVLTRQDRCAHCGIYWHRRDAVAEDVAEPLAAWLEGQSKRFNSEMVRDRPECPSCDTVPVHNHPADSFHDGDENRAGCERPVGGPDDYRCTCFDDALAVARALLGEAP